ncbi:MAG: DUF2513 domain-containing protein [Gammaproteobacteria bacterium]
MKRDWDVIRQVLTEIEEDNQDRLTYGDQEDRIKTRHAFLLRDAGFISGIDASTMEGKALLTPELTWEGHELLATIRSKPLWEKITKAAQDKGIELSFEAVIALAKTALAAVLSPPG